MKISMSGTWKPVVNNCRPGRGRWMTNIGSQGYIACRYQCAAIGGNGQKVQGVSFGGGIKSFKNVYGVVRRNGKSGHGLNFSNYRKMYKFR